MTATEPLSTGLDPVLAETLSGLSRRLAKQSREINELRGELRAHGVDTQRRRAPAGSNDGHPGELPYRYDAAPKWIEESGWREQSPDHLKAFPVLRRLLELERFPGAQVRVTYEQLGKHVGASMETAKRRLNFLESFGVIDLKPGSGQRPTTVVVRHPIATPLAYSEVPWAAGGMAGAPAGRLEGLRGPKRAYAELYGVVLSEPAPVPDQGGDPPSEEEAPPERESGRGPADDDGPLKIPPQGGKNTPSETRDCSLEVVRRSRTRAREAAPRQKRTDRTNTPARRMERAAMEIPVAEVSEGAITDAQYVCRTLGWHEEAGASRIAQIAELLRRQGRAMLLSEAVRRIGSTQEGVIPSNGTACTCALRSSTSNAGPTGSPDKSSPAGCWPVPVHLPGRTTGAAQRSSSLPSNGASMHSGTLRTASFSARRAIRRFTPSTTH